MSTRTYTRKTDPTGKGADPSRGAPSFTSGILIALPDRVWRTAADASQVSVTVIGEISPQEDTDLTTAHTAWVPLDTRRYADTYKVETITQGRVQKVEWFETDNGDGTYSGLARDTSHAWEGKKLTGMTSTKYYVDGTPVPDTETITSYFTTSDGKRVTKVTT